MHDQPNTPRRLLAGALAAGASGLLAIPATAAPAALPPPEFSDLSGEVLKVLTRFSEFITRKDIALARQFSEDAVLVGSEEGEVTVGRPALTALMERAFAKPHTVSWEWEQPVAHRVGELVWFFVQAQVVVISAEGTQRLPYRVSGVLEWRAPDWIWRQYHGAEPAHG